MSTLLPVLLLAFALFFPSTLAVYRYFLVFLVCSLLFVRICRGRGNFVVPNVAMGVLVTICTGGVLVFYDAWRFGAVTGITFWVLAPVAYGVFIAWLSGRKDGCLILNRAIYCGSCLIAIHFVYLVAAILFEMEYHFTWLPLDQAFGLDARGFWQYGTNNLPVYLFTIPFMIIDYYVCGNRTRAKCAVLWLCVAAAVFSLRIALIVSVTAVLLLAACHSIYTRPARLRMLVFLSATIGASGLALMLVPNDIWRGIYELKLETKISGEDPRFMQMLRWIELFSERPLFGHGLSSTEMVLVNQSTGDVVFQQRGSVRNEYGYEILYGRLLSEIGLGPLVIYGLLTLGLCIGLWRRGAGTGDPIARSSLAHLAGLLSMLGASATNSYVLTFGYIWVVYFPLAHLNWIDVRGSSLSWRDHESREIDGGAWKSAGEYVWIAVRRCPWMMSAACAGAMCGIVASVLTEPVYESRSMILTSAAGGVAERLTTARLLAGSLGADPTAKLLAGLLGAEIPSLTPNQDFFVSVLRSRTIAQAVVDKFALKERYGVPQVEDAVKKLSEHTSILPAAEGANIYREGSMGVTVEDREAKVAADIANYYVELLDRYTEELARRDGGRHRDFISSQLARAKADLVKTETTLRRFQETNRAAVLSEQTSSALEVAGRVKSEIVTNEVHAQMLRGIVTDSSPEMITARRRADELNRQLAQIEYGGSPSRGQSVGEWGVPFARVPKLAMDVARLNREVKTGEMLVEFLTLELEYSRIADAQNHPVVRILDRAVPAERRSRPRIVLNAVIGIMSGLSLGVLVAFSRELFWQVKNGSGV